jgi:hypothetical protein
MPQVSAAAAAAVRQGRPASPCRAVRSPSNADAGMFRSLPLGSDYFAPAACQDRRMAASGARVAKIVAIFVVVWAVVLIGLDRGGLYLAEYEAAKTIQNSQHLASRPDVELFGVPFLTQLIAGEFDHVRVDAQGVVVSPRGQSLRIAEMDVDLYHVSVSRSFSSFHTDSADATALITYADLGATLHTQLRYAGGGALQGTKTVTVPVLGTHTGSITAHPTLDRTNQAIKFGAVQVTGLPGFARSLVTRLFDQELPLTGIPFGLQIESLTVDQAGVHLTLHGADIS